MTPAQKASKAKKQARAEIQKRGEVADYANEILAQVAMLEEIDDGCVDNHRFAYEDDPEGMVKYNAKAENGCCGFYDRHITILGRPAMIGCNYGH